MELKFTAFYMAELALHAQDLIEFCHTPQAGLSVLLIVSIFPAYCCILISIVRLYINRSTGNFVMVLFVVPLSSEPNAKA